MKKAENPVDLFLQLKLDIFHVNSQSPLLDDPQQQFLEESLFLHTLNSFESLDDRLARVVGREKASHILAESVSLIPSICQELEYRSFELNNETSTLYKLVSFQLKIYALNCRHNSKICGNAKKLIETAHRVNPNILDENGISDLIELAQVIF